MRIVHVVQRFDPARGGTETHVRHVAQEQARRGHDVTIATSAHPGAPETETREEDGARYHIRRFEARHFKGDYLLPPWLPMKGMTEFLSNSGADVFHAHGYRFATLEHAATASRKTGVPFVVTAHGFYPPENKLVALARWRYDRRRGRAALQAAARCVAVTTHEGDHYMELGVEPGHIDVVPNGIPASAFEPGDAAGFRATHKLGEGPIVLFLARLAHDKGLPDLVRAMPGILRTDPDATLVVCGRDAGARATAEAASRRLKLGERVRFLGDIADPRDAYAAADVFVLPSHYEAFGIVLLEAMAQHTPVVATTAGGMPEVVADTGIIVPPRSPNDLAIAVGSLLSDESYRQTLAKKGHARARGFLWNDIVARLEETYRASRR